MTDVETILLDTPLLRVGSWRLPRSHPHFADAGEINRPIIVFPRNSVAITYSGRPTIVASPNIVLFYNHRQEYRRHCLDEQGDRCEFFSFAPRSIADICVGLAPDAGRNPDRPFPFTHVTVDSRIYLLQRLVVDHLHQAHRDALFVEETLAEVLAAVLAGACRSRGTAVLGPPPSAAQRELVRTVQRMLAVSFQDNHTIAQIARFAGCSPFHLARVFRRVTGLTLHAYRNRVRLRHSLEMVASRERDLAGVALDLGYVTHSHFTMAFRSAYGMTPSRFRRLASEKAVLPLPQ